MAEFVEFRAEEMIPELEQLDKLGFFEKHEIRCIAKRRKDFEYKIQRRTKCKEDYLRYIRYEMDLLKLIRLRRSKHGFNQRKSEIDYSIANRVNKLFKQAIFRFQQDIRLWISYIKFCKQVKFYSSVSQMLVQMLKVHSDKPSLWKLAANWEFEENKSVENARQFLLRGLRCHPDSKLLYTEAFRLELVYADMKRKQLKTQDPQAGQTGEACNAGVQAPGRVEPALGGPAAASTRTGEDITDQVIAGRLAEVIYKSASKKVHNVTFLISLLNIAKGFSWTHKLQANIVNDLLDSFPGDELTWDAVARRELEGLCYTADPASAELPLSAACGESMETEDSESNAINSNKNSLKERIRRCCAVYVAAVKKHLPTERMWSLYLDMLLEINRDLAHLPKFKKKLLRVAFQAGHNAGLMQEKYYLQWVLLHQGKKKKLSEVLCMATERLSHSLELWQMRLRFHLSEGEEQVGVAVFRQAIALLGCGTEEAPTLPLWKMLIHYWQVRNMHQVEKVFLEGVEQGPPVSQPLKPMFLEWLMTAKGVTAARKVYESLSNRPPFCLEMHQKMAALECMHPTISLKHVRKCYELACDHFGKNNTDVWMEYVKFEKKKGDPKNVSDIYWRAIKNLDPAQKDIFISEYCLVNTELSEPSQSAS